MKLVAGLRAYVIGRGTDSGDLYPRWVLIPLSDFIYGQDPWRLRAVSF